MYTYPSWDTLLSFPTLSWTTHHCVKLADFSIPSASIHSTYLCPLPKLDCRVNKFNYSMFSIYLKFFVPPTLPPVCIQVSLEKNHVKPIRSTCTQNPLTVSPVKILFYVQNCCSPLTSSLGSSPLHVALLTLISLLHLQKVKPLPALDSCAYGFL